jgi:hypothetical protein
MKPQQRGQPRWSPSSGDWVDVFRREHEVEIARFSDPNSGRFNRVSR